MAFSANSITSRRRKTTVFVKSTEVEWPQFSKLWLEAPKFSPKFLPFVWVGLGPRLLRQNTAAFGSRARPRFRGRAAPRGEGGRGCTEQKGPWPRGRIWWRKPHETWDSVVRKWMKMLMVLVQVFRGFRLSLMESVPVCQNICTTIFCCSFWSPLCRCLHLNLLCRNRMKYLWTKNFWVRLYLELEYICFGSLSTSSWLPKSKGNSFFNQLDVIKTS